MSIDPSLEHMAVPIDSIQPHPENPRQGDVGAMAGSLLAWGQYRPAIVQESTGYIVAGSHLWMAAVQLGWAEVAVLRRDLTDTQALQLMLQDNRVADLGGYHQDRLGDVLTGLAAEGELDGTGYDGDDVDQLLADLAALDAQPVAPEPEPKAKRRRERAGADVLVVIPADRQEGFSAAVAQLCATWDTEDVSAVVVRAVIDRAAAL